MLKDPLFVWVILDYILFRCAVISSIPAGFSETFECYGMEGRYVTVVIPGRADYLILCEVEVYGSPLD